MIDHYLTGNPFNSFSSSTASQRHVTYSCGNCGFELNLSSSNRNTSTIGSKYGKSIKRGVISFLNIDESRFQQVDEFHCIIPHFSKHSWSLFRRRTKLLCRKCGNDIGTAYGDESAQLPLVTDEPESSSANSLFKTRKYDVKIRALQPSSADHSGISLHT